MRDLHGTQSAAVPVGVEERQALANVPFGWVKDAPSGIRSTLDFTTLPGVAEGWRVEGYRVVTLYSLPYLRQQPAADDAEQLAACREDWAAVCTAIGERDGGHMDPSEVVAWIEARKQPAAVNEATVERALAAYLRRQEDGESLYGCVTAALTAALAGQQQENGNG